MPPAGFYSALTSTDPKQSGRRTSAGGGLASWLYNRVVAPIGTKVRQVFNQGLTPELISLSFAFGAHLFTLFWW